MEPVAPVRGQERTLNNITQVTPPPPNLPEDPLMELCTAEYTKHTAWAVHYISPKPLGKAHVPKTWPTTKVAAFSRCVRLVV